MTKVRDYAFGFHDDVKPLFSTGKGLTEEVVREISEIKNEPQWMLDYRLRSLELFHKLPMPDFGPDLSGIRFDDIIYYQKLSGDRARRKPLSVWVFLKQSANFCQELLLNMNLR